MCGGCQASSLPRCSSSSRTPVSRPPLRRYHCRLVTTSSGRSPFSKNFTWWVIALGSPTRSPDSTSISTIRFCACLAVLPASSAYGASATPSGAAVSSRPSRPRMLRTGRSSSRHQITSVVSPNVQIIAMPEPFSGSASSWARTGTSTPNSGVVTVVPNSGW